MMISQPSLTYSVSIANTPSDFPPRQEPFVDREQELARTLKFLNPYAGPRGIFIYGQGGVGKTTLAIEAAHQSWNRNDYDELIFLTAKVQYWDINKRTDVTHNRGVSKHRFASFNGMLGKMTNLLASGKQQFFRMQSKQKKLETISGLLKDRNVLIVIDNLDTIQSEEDWDDIADFANFALPSSCKIIVTSRVEIDRITKSGFVSIPVRPFDDLSCYTLLTELLGRQGVSLTHTEYDRVLTLLVDSGGIPLIIKQIAALIIEIGSEQAITRLESLQKSILPYLFSSSISKLDTMTRRVLYTICLSGNPLTERDLSTIVGLSPIAVRDAIKKLEHWSLINRDGKYYDVHFLVREYVVSILRSDTATWVDINKSLQLFEENQV